MLKEKPFSNANSSRLHQEQGEVFPQNEDINFWGIKFTQLKCDVIARWEEYGIASIVFMLASLFQSGIYSFQYKLTEAA